MNKFDTILMNPPYSASWSADNSYLTDSRFKEYGKLAPKSKADFAFLLHGFSYLDDKGTMAVVLPHGVLFRGAAEGIIRKKLLEDGSIDAIIGLPAKLFRNTDIPTTIIILKKQQSNKDVLFIDASNEFEKGKNQNYLRDEHISKILAALKNRKNVDKFAHLASFDEIKENDFNLNIPRYVDTYEDEEPIDLVALAEEYLTIDEQIKLGEKELLDMVNEMTGDDAIIAAAKQILSVNITGQTELF